MTLKRWVTLAMLAGIALTIYLVEAQIPTPLPIPGVKLGLANIVTLLVLARFGPRDALTVLLVRIVLGSIFAGQIISFFYSLAGGLLCLLVMLLALRLLGTRQLWAVSVFGAIAHNIGQLAVAVFLTNLGILWYAPALFAAAIVTGVFTGIAAQAVLKHIPKGKI